ncbi:SDR family NAD(P)-dependent oxidoreductase [Paenibacillus soyae]|uniref:SDR family NAD(P)-dependent oxidoreductase n=1 Tax=Paenibacillus soyae TaxID=2969249 RepID=A0A9X2SAA0_9BACL|nr:SDR family NAD(P)-dependent oxidoreductase [Paenibacillus soyae]MCR2806389.1 SDR family NAD(P)-dependent oxidoreductase [Paenibacillus soyae]
MSRNRFIESLLFPKPRLDEDGLRRSMAGKTILITGASSGIGEKLAYLLGRTDACLVLVARRMDKLEAIREAIASQGGKVSVYAADLREESELDALSAWLRERPQGLDIVFSNAGKSIRRPVMESLDRFHDFQRTMAVNYFAPVRLLLAVLPELERRRGHIVNVSTINASLIPFPYWAAYQASKSAFDTWLRAAAPELNARGIRVTSCYLPLVRTPMIEPTAAYRKLPAMSPEHAARWIAAAVLANRRTIAPWWLPPGQLASLIGRGLWEWAMPHLLRRREGE